MAKMTIEFDSDDYEFFNRLALSTRMAAALWDWDQHMRALYNEKIPEQSIEKMCEIWNETIEGINFEDIYT